MRTTMKTMLVGFKFVRGVDGREVKFYRNVVAGMESATFLVQEEEGRIYVYSDRGDGSPGKLLGGFWA